MRPGRAAAMGHVLVAVRLAWRAAPGWLSLYALLSLVAAVLPLGTAWLTKLVLDRVVGANGVSGEVVALAIGLAGVGVVAAVTWQATQYVRAELDRAVALAAQEELYEAVARFTGIGRFEDPAFLDRLRLAQQASGATPSQLVTGGLAILRSAVTLGGFVVALAVLSPLMTAVVVSASIPALFAEVSLSRRRAGMLWDVAPSERREIFYGQLLSTVVAAKEIRLFGIGDFLRRRMRVERVQADAARRGIDRRELLMQSALSVLAAAIAGAGLVWAVDAAASGAITVGDVSLFIAGVAIVQGTIAGLVSDLATTQYELTVFSHYVSVVRAAPDLPVPDDPLPVPALSRGIELRDVWFRYGDEHPWILRGVDLTIPHGRSVALVGSNGAGKSTLVKLLCRFYDPTRGAILWDGVDLRDVDPAELRRRVSAVFQDYMCYELTAAENIAIGDVTAQPGPEVPRAAEEAGVHETIVQLPDGYETLLSRTFSADADGAERQGVVLSGGQWQRLALARGFLRRDADLVILDEPSAGLDAEAEHVVHQRLAQHRAGRATVLVSHRLNAVRAADEIVVLDGGRITERGSHDALLERQGFYARLFALQASGYADAAPVGGR